MDSAAFLRQLFAVAVRNAMPKPEWFAGLGPAKGRTIVVGAGKASASMARAFEEAYSGPLEGIVITRYGHTVPTSRIECIEASHPVPDEAGLSATQRIVSLVSSLNANDLVVALLSGGGSALLTLPAKGVSLAEKQDLSRQLLRCGAAIAEINAVRQALSAVKGGRLWEAAQPARVVTYVISDVPGDDPGVVGSGPTVPNGAKAGDALEIVRRYGLEVSPGIRRVLEAEQDRPRRDAEVHLVASAQMALEAAAQWSEKQGVRAHILSDALEGESREVAKVIAALARQIARRKEPFVPPCVLLSGGETTVTVRGDGRGGRNVEFLAALTQALRGEPNIYALAADTDGIDGSEDVAGAVMTPSSFARAGVGLLTALEQNDAHAIFERLGDQVLTGPTHTNVNDFRAVLIL